MTEQGISDFGSGLYALTALRQRYSSAMNFDFDTKNGEKERVHMASYGIGITRLIQTIVDQNNSDTSCEWEVNKGFTASPFDLCLIQDDKVNQEVIGKVFDSTTNKRLLMYEGQRIIGEQFSESDPIGIPVKLVFANHWRSDNKVEIELYNNNTIYFDIDNLESEINRIWS